MAANDAVQKVAGCVLFGAVLISLRSQGKAPAYMQMITAVLLACEFSTTGGERSFTQRHCRDGCRQAWFMEIRHLDYRGYCFPPEIIAYAVWLGRRFCLSSRDVEELLAECIVTVSCEAG